MTVTGVTDCSYLANLWALTGGTRLILPNFLGVVRRLLGEGPRSDIAWLAEARDGFALLCESVIPFSVCLLTRYSGLSMLSQVVGGHLR